MDQVSQIASKMAIGMKFLLPLYFLIFHGNIFAAIKVPERREFPINKKVDPCEDFYAYACSETTNAFTLSPDRAKHTFAFDDSAERLLERKKAFLKQLEQKVRQGLPLSKRSQTLGKIYGACMDVDASKQEEKANVSALKFKVDSIDSRGEWIQFLAFERALGRESFLAIASTTSQVDPQWNDFFFLVTAMTLPERSYYENKEVRSDFHKVLERFFATVGLSRPSQRADQVVAFEAEFARVNPLPREWRKIWNDPSQIGRDEIKSLYPLYQLDNFYGRIPEKTLIRHFAPQTHQWLQKKLSQTDLEVLKSVYLWRALSSKLDDGYQDFFRDYYAFQVKHLGAPAQRPDRDERCAVEVMGTYTKELDAELLPEVFPNFPEKDFVALAEQVRMAILKGIEDNTWLSSTGRQAAREKIMKARLQLVKPQTEAEWYFNPEIEPSLKEPLKNMDKLSQKLLDREFEELKVKRNPNIWSMGPLTVNAYYSASDNKFVMPIGILQYPFYDSKLPLTTNLGAVGAVIGHELGHGIDDQGSRYDAEGKLNPWMTEGDLQEFRKRGQILVQQFDRIGHQGQLTLGENIGDLTGITFAFRAAFGNPSSASQEAKKAFFLQYARLWCQVMLPKTREKILKTDPHALGVARVNQQLKNQREFAKAYACKENQGMVLPDKQRAVVW